MEKTPRNGNDLSGKTLGKWRLLEFLGEGASAHVYRAEDRLNKEWVRAVKVFFIEGPSSEGIEKRQGRLNLEALLCKDQIHPNVIVVYDPPKVINNYLLHVMTYADGGSLRDFIQLVKQEGSQVSIDEVRRWGMQIAAGLAAIHVHEKHIIHRDICPANLLLNQNNILIADLGVAQTRFDLTRRAELAGSALDHPGHFDYMSPQQRNDKRPVKPCDDIFSTGCVLFELITLKMYQGDDDTKLAPHPKKYRQDVPNWLDAIVSCCLAEKREDRFQSAEELCQSLEKQRLIRQPARNREQEAPDIDEFSDLLNKIEPMTIARGVVLNLPDDLPAAAEKDWQESLEAFFEPRGKDGFLDWLEKDVIGTLIAQRNRPVRKKMEDLLARAQSLYQQAGARDDLLTRSRVFTEFLAGFSSFHPPVVGFTPEKGLDFGEMGLGEAPLKRKLTVKNSGSSQLVYRFASKHPALVVDQHTIFTCKPGGSDSQELTFQPDMDFPTAQPPELLLQLITNIGEKEIPVHYAISPPKMELSASQLVFDAETLKVPQELIISNPGRSPLIGSIVTGVPWLRLGPPAAQFRCDPGGQYRLLLSLLPDQMPAAGIRVEDALQLKTNAGEQTIGVSIPPRPVPLTLTLAPGVEKERLLPAEQRERDEATKKEQVWPKWVAEEKEKARLEEERKAQAVAEQAARQATNILLKRQIIIKSFLGIFLGAIIGVIYESIIQVVFNNFSSGGLVFFAHFLPALFIPVVARRKFQDNKYSGVADFSIKTFIIIFQILIIFFYIFFFYYAHEDDLNMIYTTTAIIGSINAAYFLIYKVLGYISESVSRFEYYRWLDIFLIILEVLILFSYVILLMAI